MIPEILGEASVKLRLLWTSTTLNVEDLIRVLKVEPNGTWNMGDPVHPAATNVRKENCVLIQASGNSLSKAASSLIEAIRPNEAQLMLIHSDVEVELSCIITIDPDTPELHLTAAQVRFFSSLHAAFDMDVYSFVDA